MKTLVILLLLLIPAAGLCDSTSVVPTSVLIWTEQPVINGEVVPNFDVSITGAHRSGYPALGAYFQVGDGFNEAFVGPSYHRWNTDLFFGLLGAEQTDSFRYRWTVSGFYASGKKTALLVYERSSAEDTWLRGYADYRVASLTHLGWIIQRGMGGGPRLQIDIPMTNWPIWGAGMYDGNGLNPIFALQAAF